MHNVQTSINYNNSPLKIFAVTNESSGRPLITLCFSKVKLLAIREVSTPPPLPEGGRDWMQTVRNRKKYLRPRRVKCFCKCCVRWCADESSVPIRWFVLQRKACACNVYTYLSQIPRISWIECAYTCPCSCVCVCVRVPLVSIHSCTQALLYCGIRESISSDSIELPPIRSSIFL